MTGRLLSTRIPQRQGCRISDFNFPASNGLAGNPHTREATPIHPGLVCLPGSQSIFDTPDVADQPGRSSLRRAPRGSVLGRCRTFFPLRRQPGSNPAQHVSKPFGCVAPSVFGSAHGFNHGASDGREVVNLCREFGNVCCA